MDGFDIVAAVPAAVTDDRDGAYQTMRGDLITYWSLPFYRAMIERSGFDPDAVPDRAGIPRRAGCRRHHLEAERPDADDDDQDADQRGHEDWARRTGAAEVDRHPIRVVVSGPPIGLGNDRRSYAP